jgi:S-adenosylmethionine decarboxylase
LQKISLLETKLEAETQVPSLYGTMGRHIIADLSGCNKKLISSVSFVQNILEEAVKKAKATIISSRFHQFTPIGVSGIVLLSESHCSIHTWPDEEYAAIDIYTCGEHVYPKVACDHIADKLEASRVYITSLERGLRSYGAYKHETKSSQELELVSISQ